MIKRICTALIAVMIGAGAFTVPAFAYTGEDADAAVPAVTADVTADTGSDTVFYLKNKKSQAESAERPDPDADYREDDDGYDIPEESEEDETEDSDDEEE